MTNKKYAHLLSPYANIKLVEYHPPMDNNLEPAQTILYSPAWPEGAILELAAQGHFQTFLNSQNKNFEDALLTALKVQNDPGSFLRNPLWGLFQNAHTSLSLPFLKPEDKQTLLDQVDPFVKQIGSILVSENTRILFEELFMNAVFDAPTEAKNRGFSKTNHQCQMTLAFDEAKMTITCFDSYGSLPTNKLIKRMRDIEQKGTKEVINLGDLPGGAGIGCSLLHRYSSSLIIVVKKGEGSLVSCSIPLKTSLRGFGSLGKNLQVINIHPSGGQHGK